MAICIEKLACKFYVQNLLTQTKSPKFAEYCFCLTIGIGRKQVVASFIFDLFNNNNNNNKGRDQITPV
jgi:hypothetical protein